VKYLSILIIGIILNFTLFGQDKKRGNVWNIGFTPIVYFDFNSGSLSIDTLNSFSGSTFGSSNICGANGKLLFSSLAFFMLTKENKLMEQQGVFVNTALGDKFRIKETNNAFWNQQSIILPKQGDQYYVFTTGMSDEAFDRWQAPGSTFDSFGMDVLSYHIVDMAKNNGKGGVTSKNNILIHTPYLSQNTMQATRHGNGKDWWLMKPGKERHTFYTFMVSADTILGPYTQEFPYPHLTPCIHGQSKFNQAGDKFVFCGENFEGDYHLYDFDRCTGLLSNYQHLYIPYDSSIHYDDWVSGVSFSENDRFLYVNSNYYLYQVDMQNNYETIKVGEFTQSFPKWDASALAPDGKIYLGNQNGVVKTMSYIDKPNEKGLACDFKPMALSQPFTNIVVPPNMPNYGLGVAVNSPCDTIRTAPLDWVLYPNPTKGIIKIKAPTQLQRWQQYATINIYNMQGQRILQARPILNTDYEMVINVGQLASGLYTVELHSDALLGGGARKLWKVVVE
jgi:Secretion system C-terminal sorting domain